MNSHTAGLAVGLCGVFVIGVGIVSTKVKISIEKYLLLRYLQHTAAMMGMSCLSTIPIRGGDTMAFWSKKDVDFAEMKELIAQQPGISAAELARQLDVERSTIARRLPSLGEAGFLLYEDDDGGLYPFNPDA